MSITLARLYPLYVLPFASYEQSFDHCFPYRQYAALTRPIFCICPALSVTPINLMPMLLHSLAAAHKEPK